jgi:RHS repeat-associated protein
VTHDADGNLTAIGTQTSTWNPRGQLTATGAGNVGYGYDGLGRRVTRSVSGAANARYLYDGWNLVQEQSGTGTVTANSLVGLGLGQTYRRSETSGTTRNYLTDALGSTLALASGMATPTVNTEYTYEPYGKPTTTGSATTNPFAFTGLVWDSGSGMYDNRFRQLNPAIARFGSEDPIDVRGGWNLYGYSEASPTMLRDSMGLDPSPGSCTPMTTYTLTALVLQFSWSDDCSGGFGAIRPESIGVGLGVPGVSVGNSWGGDQCMALEGSLGTWLYGQGAVGFDGEGTGSGSAGGGISGPLPVTAGLFLTFGRC